MTKLMEGKRGLIMGVANNHSIAWGIASKLAEHGAELAFTYQNDKLKSPTSATVGLSRRAYFVSPDFPQPAIQINSFYFF